MNYETKLILVHPPEFSYGTQESWFQSPCFWLFLDNLRFYKKFRGVLFLKPQLLRLVLSHPYIQQVLFGLHHVVNLSLISHVLIDQTDEASKKDSPKIEDGYPNLYKMERKLLCWLVSRDHCSGLL